MASLPSRWQAPRALRAAIPAPWWPWLVSSDSLTQRLIDASPAPLHVQVLREGHLQPNHDEALRLGCVPGRLAWIREVLLVSGTTPWVAARSVIPRDAVDTRLRQQGTQPLGAWLFNRPGIERSAIELTRRAPTFVSLPSRWGRRSVFHKRGDRRFTLLVQEYFLAAMGETLALP